MNSPNYGEAYNPKCHVLVDLNELGQQNNTKNSKYYRTLMPSTSLGITKPAMPIGKHSGLMSFNPPDDEFVFAHELAHLCGLSDVENATDNLMYKNKKDGRKLGNIPLKAKLDDDNRNGSGTERQWDCLHAENDADGCLTKAYRLLNF